ncbi:uncharacterized protein LOC126740670 [Anthonomus grandis grandis]|uniref:uncharacterized protein LOC126740670 n=1 Tax=Anthonomus grandis grandis TaxID=2921223 RepID=UPI0021652315|nr:uncharacterized protein LOC126740670 [Anthonomus grandis grandis]
MRQYLDNGHISLVSQDEKKPNFVAYLPHHCVFKPEKSTTKLRIVFNASAKGSKGISLNESLLPGPKLQPDITSILLKFRFYAVGFSADIKQMYLQILLTPKDRDFQRLLWRFDSQGPLQEYRLNTVTFGVSSSPFLAIRTVQELACQESHRYPNACEILRKQMFIDDICAGACSIHEAVSLQKDLIGILKSGGFELRKWASNCPTLLKSFSQEECQIPITSDKENSSPIKVLGLQWNPSTDTFSYTCQPSDKSCTKRHILSEIARIFDPLGFLSPVTFSLSV